MLYQDGGTEPCALRGGEAMLLSLAGEPFVEYALGVREIAPAASLMTLGYTDGSIGYRRLPAEGQLAPCRDGVILLVGKGSNGPTGSQLRGRALPENVSMIRNTSGRVPGSVIHVGLAYIDLRPSHRIE